MWKRGQEVGHKSGSNELCSAQEAKPTLGVAVRGGDDERMRSPPKSLHGQGTRKSRFAWKVKLRSLHTPQFPREVACSHPGIL